MGSLPRQLIVVFLCLFLWCCNQNTEVPFPKELTENQQPETVPLEMTAPQQLHWDTVKRTPVIPTVFHLDFSKMKGIPYDADGFMPLEKRPVVVPFEMDTLPSMPFYLDKVPAKDLKMNMQPLAAPRLVGKAMIPERVASSPLDMSSWPIVDDNYGVFFLKLDSSGVLWIGSGNGLYQYDGSAIKKILSGVSVSGFNIDKKGRLWFVSQKSLASTINVLDFKNQTMGEQKLPFIIPLGQSLFSDDEGMLWLSSYDPAIAVIKIDPIKMNFQVISRSDHLRSDRYYQIEEDGKNNIWLTGRNGVDIIDKANNRIIHLNKDNGLSTDTVTAITRGPDGSMWLGSTQGVDAVDLKNNSITHFEINGARNDRPFKLFFDNHGQLWIGKMNSLHILDVANKSIRDVKTDLGIGNNAVLDIVQNRNGDVILTSINPVSQTFPGMLLVFRRYGKTVYPFGNKDIYSTVEDSREHLWIGTTNQLFVVDSARKTYWQIDTSQGLSDNLVQSVTEQNGNLVITTNNGYNVFDAEKGEFLRYGKFEKMFADTIYSVDTDASGNVWISAAGDGVYKYDPSGNLITNLNESGGLNGNYAIQTLTLKNHNIWVATNGTPGIIDPSANTIQLIKNFPEISNPAEKSIFVDSYDRLWIGLASPTAPGGLFMIDTRKKTISKFTTKNGLSENHGFSILEKDGKIFVGAGRKVNIITPPELAPSKKWEVHILKGSESLAKITNSYASDALTARGNYIWGDKGVHVIYGLEADTSLAKPAVSGIDLMAQAVDFRLRTDSLSNSRDLAGLEWDSVAGPYFMPVNLSMPYNKNVMQFHFSELGSIRSDTIRYAYILEGLESKWTTTTDNHTQTYLNLAPGRYTFKVSSKSAGNRWSNPATFSFAINPPWYNTWWAYLLYIAGGILILRMYLELRSRKLKRENRILEDKVKHRTEELEQSYYNVEQLGQIGRKITSSLSVEKIIRTAYKNVNSLMDASVFGIGIYNAQNETLDFPATYENGAQLPFYSNSIHDKNRFGALCYNSGKEISMGNLNEQHKDYIQQLPAPHAGKQSVSLLYLPLTINEKKLGVITVQSFKKDAYTDNHLNMLRNIANYTAIALENAESYSKLNQSLINLKDTQAQLIQSEKMASLGELTAGIAHEIQNPLNFVNNFSDVNMELLQEMKQEISSGNFEEVKLLADDILGNEEKINHHGKRADAIVKGMLQHSRNNTGQREFVDINALADEYLRLSFHGLRAKNKSFNATMKTDFDKSLSANGGKIHLVPQDIGRVILNLFNNAFYAVTERKKVHPENYEPTVTVTTRKNQNHVEVHITDNGNGIPESITDKIFHPFFTTKPTGQGTGLGLSLSYDIIKAHGGELRFITKEGEGTEFVVELPIS